MKTYLNDIRRKNNNEELGEEPKKKSIYSHFSKESKHKFL
jgi:hypothetical protein